MTVGKGGCNGVFTNHLIYSDPGASFGKIFDNQAIDGGDVLYVVAAGKSKAGQSTTNLWLFTSHDQGATWSPPIQVNTPDLKANVMPAIAGGLAKDQVVIGWFGHYRHLTGPLRRIEHRGAERPRHREVQRHLHVPWAADRREAQ